MKRLRRDSWGLCIVLIFTSINMFSLKLLLVKQWI